MKNLKVGDAVLNKRPYIGEAYYIYKGYDIKNISNVLLEMIDVNGKATGVHYSLSHEDFVKNYEKITEAQKRIVLAGYRCWFINNVIGAGE